MIIALNLLAIAVIALGVVLMKLAKPESVVVREFGRACLWAGTFALVLGLANLGSVRIDLR